jgi:hypothetical protein
LEYQGRVYPNTVHWFRSDNDDLLGTFGNRRDVIQPVRFVEFFQKFCLSSPRNITLDVVGSLDQGRTFYMASKISESLQHELRDSTLGSPGSGMALADRRSSSYVEKADRTDIWLVVTDYYKETKAPKAFVVTNELVCSNGMSRVARDEACSLTHLRTQNFGEVAAVLDSAVQEATQHLQMKEQMVNTTITMDSARNALRTFFDDQDAETKKVRMLERLYEGDLLGGDLPTRQDNVWRLWNTVTQYTSHVGVRKGKEEARFRSQLEGQISKTNKEFTHFLQENYV